MADYIYLLEHRLASAQRAALNTVREVARQRGLTLFLVGGAVRDLTSGSPVRDLDVVIQGQNARQLRKDLEKAGAIVSGEQEAMQTLHLRFPGGVRMELGSTISIAFPKPGKPVAKPSTILEDLRRRDFTANAMALSLNEGSYGLLMDPLNGVADIENRQLRLVSNYGFIEDPVRMIRASRLMARLGWTLDERTQTRYENSKNENSIGVLSDYARGYELEEIVHEEDPLRILKRLEAEGWMKVLSPSWTVAKVNVGELDRLRDVQTHLQVQGIHADTAAASFPLLTAKLSAKEASDLKGSFPRSGFVQEIDSLEAEAKEFAAQLGGKAATAPSDAWKLINAARPEVVLWTSFSSKSGTLQARFKAFAEEWPQARNRMPYTLMQEMRITPDVPGYDELLETLFFQLMDGKLSTQEEMKAVLEPYSPPAPPPPVNLRRARAAKKEARPKSRARKAKAEAAEIDAEAEETDFEAEAPAAEIDGKEEPTDDFSPDSESEQKEAAEPVSKARRPALPLKTEKPTAAPVSKPAKQEVQAQKPAGAASRKTSGTKDSTKSTSEKGSEAPTAARKAVPVVESPRKTAKTTTAKTTPAKSAPVKAAAKKTSPVKAQVKSAAAAKDKQPASRTAPSKTAAGKKAPVKSTSDKRAVGKTAAKKAPPPASKKTPAKAARGR